MRSLCKKVFKPLLSLLYPPICLHCSQKLNEASRYLCPACFAELQLLDPRFRCPFCFAGLEAQHEKMCTDCRRGKRGGYRTAAAFEYSSPLAALLSGLSNQKQPYLAKGIGGFLVMQWTHMNWEKPDVTVPVPRPMRQKIRQGYDHNELLALEVGKILQVPLQHALGYDDDEAPPFRVKSLLDDKKVLLIADRTTSLMQAAERVVEAFPGDIRGLALCFED